jgi:hypothetical protein
MFVFKRPLAAPLAGLIIAALPVVLDALFSIGAIA